LEMTSSSSIRWTARGVRIRSSWTTPPLMKENLLWANRGTEREKDFFFLLEKFCAWMG
jgi:hypothetical protein